MFIEGMAANGNKITRSETILKAELSTLPRQFGGYPEDTRYREAVGGWGDPKSRSTWRITPVTRGSRHPEPVTPHHAEIWPGMASLHRVIIIETTINEASPGLPDSRYGIARRPRYPAGNRRRRVSGGRRRHSADPP